MLNLMQRFDRLAGRRSFLVLLAVGMFSSFGIFAGAAQAPAVVTNFWAFRYSYPQANVEYNTSTATPAIAPDGTIYAGSFDGTLTALTPEGRLKWRFRAGREIHSSAAIGTDGTLYFGARDRKFYAVTPAGRLKWTFPTGGWVDSSPAIAADGTIYFGSWDGGFYAVNPTGSLKWKFTTGDLVDSSPAIGADGTIYFGSHDKKLYALTPAGQLRWAFLTGGAILSSPAIGADGTVYFSALDGNLYALNPDGTGRWQVHTGGATDGSPVIDETGNILLAVNNSTRCFSSAGQPLWYWPSALPLMVSPAAAVGCIYVSRPWRELHGVVQGNQMQLRVLLEENVSSSPVISSEGVIYASCGQRLVAIRPPLPVPPAKSSWPMFRANARHTGRLGDN